MFKENVLIIGRDWSEAKQKFEKLGHENVSRFLDGKRGLKTILFWYHFSR